MSNEGLKKGKFMKLEHQVANHDLCRELKGPEVKQESVFYWFNQKNRELIGR